MSELFLGVCVGVCVDKEIVCLKDEKLLAEEREGLGSCVCKNHLSIDTV